MVIRALLGFDVCERYRINLCGLVGHCPIQLLALLTLGVVVFAVAVSRFE